MQFKISFVLFHALLDNIYLKSVIISLLHRDQIHKQLIISNRFNYFTI